MEVASGGLSSWKQPTNNVSFRLSYGGDELCPLDVTRDCRVGGLGIRRPFFLFAALLLYVYSVIEGATGFEVIATCTQYTCLFKFSEPDVSVVQLARLPVPAITRDEAWQAVPPELRWLRGGLCAQMLSTPPSKKVTTSPNILVCPDMGRYGPRSAPCIGSDWRMADLST